VNLPLFDRYAVDDICASRHGGSPESEDAYAAVKPRKEDLHEAILRELQRRGESGATCEQLSRALGMRYTTTSARISELKRQGRVVSTGERRPTTTGCMAAVLSVAY